MLRDAAFYIMLAFLFSHELDAVRRHEWRVLPLTSFLPDRTAAQLFIFMHVPLFFFILWFSREGTASSFAAGMSVFSIVHVGLHWIYRKHPAYEFNNISSWSLIVASGAFGALHLLLVGF